MPCTRFTCSAVHGTATVTMAYLDRGGGLGGMSQRVQEKMAAGLITGVLRGLHYPIGKEGLGHEARQRGAPGALLELPGQDA